MLPLPRRFAPGDVEARLGWLLIASTVPAGLLGLALEHRLQALFANASVVAVALILNGGVLLAAERLRDRTVAEGPHDDAQLARLGWGQAFFFLRPSNWGLRFSMKAVAPSIMSLEPIACTSMPRLVW